MVDRGTIIPDYILKAIFFAHGPISRSVVFNILNYRLDQITKAEGVDAATVAGFRAKLEMFREGLLDFPGIRAAMLEAFPADEINDILVGL